MFYFIVIQFKVGQECIWSLDNADKRCMENTGLFYVTGNEKMDIAFMMRELIQTHTETYSA